MTGGAHGGDEAEGKGVRGGGSGIRPAAMMCCGGQRGGGGGERRRATKAAACGGGAVRRRRASVTSDGTEGGAPGCPSPAWERQKKPPRTTQHPTGFYSRQMCFHSHMKIANVHVGTIHRNVRIAN
jgi:hypothetical protein